MYDQGQIISGRSPSPKGSGITPGAEPIGLLTLWRIIWAKRWLIASVTMAFIVLGVLATRSNTETYTAESLLLIQGSDASLTTTVSPDATAADTQTAVVVYGSRRVFETVVDQLGLLSNPEFNPFVEPATPGGADAPDTGALGWLTSILQSFLPAPDEDTEPASEELQRQLTVRTLQERVQIVAARGSSLVQVFATSEDPEMAMSLANVVAEAFLQDLAQSRLDAFDRVIQQLSGRIVELRQEVRDANQDLQSFTNSTTVADPVVIDSMLEEASRLRARLAENELQTQRDQDALASLVTLTNASDTQVADAFAMNEALNEIADANPGLIGADLVSVAGVELTNRITRRVELNNRLQSSLTQLEGRIASQSEGLIRSQQLQREADAKAEIYEFSVRRLNELSVQSGIEGSGGRVVSEAQLPIFPNGQGRRQVVIVLAILGFVTAIGYVLIREATNQRVRTTADVSAVLGGRKCVSLPAAPIKSLFGQSTYSERMLTSDDSTPYAGAVRRLRIALLAGQPENTPLSLTATSDLLSTGKTVSLLALARSCALVGKRVIVIDADMRRSGVAKQLRLPTPAVGLQDVLLGSAEPSEPCQSIDKLGFDVLLPRKLKENPTDLLEHPSFGSLLANAKAEYDLVLVDTPPVLAAPDALQVMAAVDRTMFVVGADASTRETLNAALSEMPFGLSDDDFVVLYGEKDVQKERAARAVRRLAHA